MRKREGFIRQGSKILPADTGGSINDWQRWIRPGLLVRLNPDFVLIRDFQNDWEGKQALKKEDQKWYAKGDARVILGHPGRRDKSLDVDLLPIIGVYLGELGRRSISNNRGQVARTAVHGFLLPGGHYIVHPEAFLPLSEEENSNDG